MSSRRSNLRVGSGQQVLTRKKPPKLSPSTAVSKLPGPTTLAVTNTLLHYITVTTSPTYAHNHPQPSRNHHRQNLLSVSVNHHPPDMKKHETKASPTSRSSAAVDPRSFTSYDSPSFPGVNSGSLRLPDPLNPCPCPSQCRTLGSTPRKPRISSGDSLDRGDASSLAKPPRASIAVSLSRTQKIMG